jgi:hypothetical protein
MPRGGKRRGAGRKAGASTRKTRAVANAAAAGMKCTPLDYMLAIISDESAPEHRRDAMAVASASFVHPKLSAVANVSPSATGCIATIQILGIARGGRYDSSTGTVTFPDGSNALEPFQPMQPTAGLTDQTAEPAAPEVLEPLEVTKPEADDGKVERLDRWRRRDDAT